MKYLLFLTMITMFLLQACDVPYTGNVLTVNDIDNFIETTGEDTVCLADGFDSVCIKMIQGQDGKDGKDGISIVGPQGLAGKDGKDGKRGRHGFPGRHGKDGAIVIIETPYLLLETRSDSFTLMISNGIPKTTPDIYVTPIATLKIPVGGGVPTILPTSQPVSIKPAVSPPIQQPTPKPDTTDKTIWHVRYKVNNGQAYVYVYPRKRDIQKEPHFDTFGLEMQGDRKSVQHLLENKLAEDNATLNTVDGVQGIVN